MTQNISPYLEKYLVHEEDRPFSHIRLGRNQLMQKERKAKVTSYLFGVIAQVRVVFRKTVVGDWRFDYLSGSHLQSQVKIGCQMMAFTLKSKTLGS